MKYPEVGDVYNLPDKRTDFTKPKPVQKYRFSTWDLTPETREFASSEYEQNIWYLVNDWVRWKLEESLMCYLR